MVVVWSSSWLDQRPRSYKYYKNIFLHRQIITELRSVESIVRSSRAKILPCLFNFFIYFEYLEFILFRIRIDSKVSELRIKCWD